MWRVIVFIFPFLCDYRRCDGHTGVDKFSDKLHSLLLDEPTVQNDVQSAVLQMEALRSMDTGAPASGQQWNHGDKSHRDTGHSGLAQACRTNGLLSALNKKIQPRYDWNCNERVEPGGARRTGVLNPGWELYVRRKTFTKKKHSPPCPTFSMKKISIQKLRSKIVN